ncbi:hypothetical protein RQP46_008998 [Phenoliferia psychrophenolica]
MATFSLLPTELLAYILYLSTEGKTVDQQQRGRFAFALVARGCYLATVAATSFFVAGAVPARALAAKLERERKWAAQEDRKEQSGRTTRASLSFTRLTSVRSLSIILDKRTNGKDIAALLRATPDLDMLDLGVKGPTQADEWIEPAMPFGVVVAALAGLTLLTPLTSLKELDLNGGIWVEEEKEVDLFSPLALGNLRDLRLNSQVGLVALASAAKGGLKTLSLGGTSSSSITDTGLNELLPFVDSVTSFSMGVRSLRLLGFRQDHLLKLIGAMPNLKTIALPERVIGDLSEFLSLLPQNKSNPHPHDEPTLPNLLATLPFLASLTIFNHTDTFSQEAATKLQETPSSTPIHLEVSTSPPYVRLSWAPCAS